MRSWTLFFFSWPLVLAFQCPPSFLSRTRATAKLRVLSDPLKAEQDDLDVEQSEIDDDEAFELLFEEEPEPLTNIERAWRYAKKPLLSIGSKGATFAHGNSLRQLLDAHTIVKVKINTRKFDGSLESAFEHLKELAEEAGAGPGMELLQARDHEKILLIGLPGTAARIERGDFPPQP